MIRGNKLINVWFERETRNYFKPTNYDLYDLCMIFWLVHLQIFQYSENKLQISKKNLKALNLKLDCANAIANYENSIFRKK